MQEADNRTIPEVVTKLHDLAREMEKKTPLSMKQEAFELRRIADRIAHLESMEREERYKHVHEFTPHRLPPSLYMGGDCCED